MHNTLNLLSAQIEIKTTADFYPQLRYLSDSMAEKTVGNKIQKDLYDLRDTLRNLTESSSAIVINLDKEKSYLLEKIKEIQNYL